MDWVFKTFNMFIVGKYYKVLTTFGIYASELSENLSETPIDLLPHSRFLFLGSKIFKKVTDLKILVNGKVRYLTIEFATEEIHEYFELCK